MSDSIAGFLNDHGQEIDKLCYEHHKLLKKRNRGYKRSAFWRCHSCGTAIFDG